MMGIWDLERNGRSGGCSRAGYKAAILAEYDAAERGHRGEILRREGLDSSHVIEWRRARDGGGQPASALRRGKDPRDAQIEAFTARAARAEVELARSKAALDIMGKVSALLEALSESADTDPRSSR